jgi:hypothetical protein
MANFFLPATVRPGEVFWDFKCGEVVATDSSFKFSRIESRSIDTMLTVQTALVLNIKKCQTTRADRTIEVRPARGISFMIIRRRPRKDRVSRSSAFLS